MALLSKLSQLGNVSEKLPLLQANGLIVAHADFVSIELVILYLIAVSPSEVEFRATVQGLDNKMEAGPEGDSHLTDNIPRSESGKGTG